MTWISVAILSVLIIETGLRLPLSAVLMEMNMVARKAIHILGAKAISDHWKEKVMLAYAFSLFKNTAIIAGFMLLIAAIVIVFIAVCNYLGVATGEFILSWVGIVFSCIVAMLYFKIRKSNG